MDKLVDRCDDGQAQANRIYCAMQPVQQQICTQQAGSRLALSCALKYSLYRFAERTESPRYYKAEEGRESESSFGHHGAGGCTLIVAGTTDSCVRGFSAVANHHLIIVAFPAFL